MVNDPTYGKVPLRKQRACAFFVTSVLHWVRLRYLRSAIVMALSKPASPETVVPSASGLFDRSRFQLSLGFVAGIALLTLLLAGIPLSFASSTKIFSDGDVSWHIASGRWILLHHTIPTVDPFSFTLFGHPWIAMEWLADVAYGAAFALAGYAGVAALVAAALVILHAIVFLHVRRSFGPLGICASFAAMDAVLGTFLFARPHLLVWPILAAWTALLLRSSQGGKPPSYWSLLLLVLWTNIHASFPLAILIAGAISLDALVSHKWATWPQWTAFLSASVIALMMNANGLRGLLQPFHIAGLKMLPSILEWQPSSPSLTPQFFVVLLLGLGALLWRGVTIPIGRLLLLLMLLGFAFMQVRHQEWFIIVAALVLPPLFGSKGWTTAPPAWPVGLIAVLTVAARAILPIVPEEDIANPRHLIAAVPESLRLQPVLNGYSFGGPLILAGIRPYIDGRAEMYGDEFFADYQDILGGDTTRFDRAVKRYDIRWTMLPLGSGRLTKAIESSGKWRRIYSNQVGVIDVRVSAEAVTSARP